MQTLFSQHSSRNNYTGDWESSESWNPVWATPQTNISGFNITIYGFITLNGPLTFSGSAANLTIYDTLVIEGNLYLSNNNRLTIMDNGILIIRGNLTIDNETDIAANGYLIITGGIIKLGTVHHGSFTSNDNPVKVFIGGTNNVGNTEDNYPVLNCPARISFPYTFSGCSYGNMEDAAHDPIYSFFQSTLMSVVATADPGTVCAGSNVQLSASVIGGSGSYTYAWSSIPAGFTSTIKNPIAAPQANTIYYVSVFDGFITVNTHIAVTIKAKPGTPVITANGPTTFCAGGSVRLTSSPGITYLWSDGATEASILVSAAGSYSVSVTNAGGCRSEESGLITVVVNPVPSVNITSSGISMCIDDIRTLTGDPAGGTFIISDGPGNLSGNVLTATGTGIISLEYNYINLCPGIATQTIRVHESPDANAGPGQELKFITETVMAAELLSSETGTWSVISGSGNFIDYHSPTTVVSGLSIGLNIFQWKVANGNCESDSEVKITVYDLFIPSVITPDGDGKNDFFKISENIGKVEIIIFNRWGNEEYANGNYLNDWDGRNNKGLEMPADTYFYILKLENAIVKKGSVLIKR